MNRWKEIGQKVETGKRLDSADGVFLFAEADLHQLGQLADQVRRGRWESGRVTC